MTTKAIQRLSSRIAPPAFVAPLVATAMACVCAGALAQTSTDQPEVTVRGLGTVQRTQVGRDFDQVPLEQLQLSRTVSYGDLDLHTQAGQIELKRRIQYTAANVCHELYSLYPSAEWTGDSKACVRGAVQSAMNRLPAHVAAVEKSTPTVR